MPDSLSAGLDLPAINASTLAIMCTSHPLKPASAIRGLRGLLGASVAAAIVLVACTKAGPPPPMTFHMTASLVSSQAVSTKVIASKGATLTARGQDGTVFRLTVPPKALLRDTTVTLTPLTNITGVPGQTWHLGADIAPAGTRLYEFATLEIIPKTPFATPPYWLEHTGLPERLIGRPAFPMKGSRGMLLAHFSGGSAVGGTDETTTRYSTSGTTSTTDSRYLGYVAPEGKVTAEWLQGVRNDIQQRFDDGKMTAAQHDHDMASVTDYLDTLDHAAVTTVLAQIDQLQANGLALSTKAEALASKGRLEDLEELNADIVTMINDERMAQLAGMPSKFNPLQPVITFFSALVGNCESQAIPPDLFVSLARQAALLGYETSGADLTRCVCSGPDKPAGICSPPKPTETVPEKSPGWVIKDIADVAGVHVETLGKSCESELGPWTLAKREISGGMSFSHTLGPVTLDPNGAVQTTMRTRVGEASITATISATIVPNGDGYWFEAKTTKNDLVVPHAHMSRSYGAANDMVQRFRIRPAEPGECR